MQIRPMLDSDLDAAVQVTAANNWGDMRPGFAFHIAHPDCHCFVAEIGGQVVATGVGTCRGPVGWVGQITVAPEYRGQGIGTAMTRHVMDDLTKAGARTLMLIATAMGRPIYEKLGFAVDSEMIFLTGPSLQGPALALPLRPLEPGDLPWVCALDREATGEDRSAQIIACTPCGGWVTEDRSAFWVTTPWGGGPMDARDPMVGCALLDFARTRAGQQRIPETTHALPSGNRTAISHLTAEGYRETNRLARMCLGEPLSWRPEMVFGRFSGAM